MMKTKSILISAAAIVLLALGLFLYLHFKNNFRPQKAEISRFLYGFSNRVNEGNTDSLLAYFEADKKVKVLNKLVNLLSGKKTFDGKSKPLANIKLDIDAADIKIVDNELAIATIPVTFTHDSLDSKVSVLILKIHTVAPHKYKIMQVDARQFLGDYVVYENYVKSKTLTDKDIYSAITLRSFEIAKQLRTKYDSVIWFSHIKDSTYYYVVKGEWAFYNLLSDGSKTNYKMGLVGPDLKIIIPIDFDLIRDIGGTFDNLIEVEKDHKRGFYNLTGKIIVPVIYDQVFPLNNSENLAALRKGSEFYWLKRDFSVSEKVDLKYADILPKLKQTGTFKINNNTADKIIEFNSREEHGSIYLAPSYLVDLNILRDIETFKNPLRNNIDYLYVSDGYEVQSNTNVTNHTENNNWFESVLYSIRNNFLGGRSDFYDERNIVVLDKKRNKVYTTKVDINYNPYMGGESLSNECNDNSINAINDSLFEVKTAANVVIGLHNDDQINEITMYHYFELNDDKLIELNTGRMFGFTKYRKMDDSYLNGCFIYFNKKTDPNNRHVHTDKLDDEALRFMKNEIYADYHYKFKDSVWTSIFAEIAGGEYKGIHPNVDDSLTTIDKYNINFITNKLKQLQKPVANAKAAK